MKKESQIYRITIDERLSDDLIRVLFAELKTIKTGYCFNDNINSWNEEEALLINPEMWIKHFSIPSFYAKKYPISSLYEGQVFLCGNISFNKSKNSDKKFKINKSSQRKLNDITSYVKDDIKMLYRIALTGKSYDHKKNQS